MPTRHEHHEFSPKIVVMGVGGAGSNAIERLIDAGIEGVDCVAINTDAQALTRSRAMQRIQIGVHISQGLGAGARPEIGRASAEEASEEIEKHLQGAHMLFLAAGMGGGTGTGATPVIARLARQMGILTVAIVTKPFEFEGGRRMRAANHGIEELRQLVDTYIVIPNQNIFRVAGPKTTLPEAFQMADSVLINGIRGILDLMLRPGMVNLDFADIRTSLNNMGLSVLGTGVANGPDRAEIASEQAINNPLLEENSIENAASLLINISGGEDMTLFDVEQAANRIRKEVPEDASVIIGTSVDHTLNGEVRICVIASGDRQAVAEAQAPVAAETPAGAEPAPQPIAQPAQAASTPPRPTGLLNGLHPFLVAPQAPPPSAVPPPMPVAQRAARNLATGNGSFLNGRPNVAASIQAQVLRHAS